MKLLALDTSTEACSAALLIDGEIRSLYRVEARAHSRLILDFCARLLAQAELDLSRLDALAFGRGPGAFTGLRIGAAVTQGLALAGGLGVAPVSSLAAIAQGMYQAHATPRVLSAIDARMGEVYWGQFRLDEHDLMRAETTERVCAPDQVPLPGPGEFAAAGTGWQSHGEVLLQRLGRPPTRLDPQRYVHAEHIARLGAYELAQGSLVPPEQALPVYLRNQVAQKSHT